MFAADRINKSKRSDAGLLALFLLIFAWVGLTLGLSGVSGALWAGEEK